MDFFRVFWKDVYGDLKSGSGIASIVQGFVSSGINDTIEHADMGGGGGGGGGSTLYNILEK